ncbi:MAG: FtsW/RodA/SpoVE family cell cycle protein, partial [Oscillospiraceae bacterium]
MIQKINQLPNQPTKPKMKKLDAQFMVLILLMTTFGLIMVFSASYPAALHKFDNSYHFIIRQAVFAVAGIIAMYILSFIDYHLYQKLVFIIFGAGIVLLLLVLVIGTRLNGAKRWINLGFTTFQPSDYVKFALIVMFAHLATINHKKMKSFQYGVMPFGVCIVIVCALMMLQPHLSGTILMVAIGGVMMFIAGTQFRYFGGIILLGILSLAVIFFLDKGYMAGRIDNWLHPLENITSGNWQTVQSLIAIGSGGFLGRGLGSSYQKFLYLPEPHNDFIFAIIC